MSLLITESNGQLGSEIRELAANYSKLDFVFRNSHLLDIFSFEGLYSPRKRATMKSRIIRFRDYEDQQIYRKPDCQVITKANLRHSIKLGLMLLKASQ